jgi:hypothetical protein
MELGIKSEDFAGSYSDKTWFNVEYDQQWRACKTNPKLGVKTEASLMTNLGEIISLVPLFLMVSEYCFHPDFSLRPQFFQNWGTI